MLVFKLITLFLFILRINGNENDTAPSLEITTAPSDVVVLLGQNASFTCEATGNGTLNITWQKNYRRPGNHHWHPNGTELVVTTARDKDCANITCVVRNEDGDQVTSSATLTVISKLNVSMTVENVTGSSAEVNYSISRQLLEASDLTFNIQYNSTTTVAQSSVDFTTLSGVVTLTNLMPNTEYLFWMAARASDGITVTSEAVNFKTSIVAPRVAPALKNLTALNSTAIVVEWFPINDTREVVIGYAIVWRRHGHNQSGVVNVPDASSTNHVIAGLKKYSIYNITIAAYNGMGIGPHSEPNGVRTEADVPETSIHNLISTAVNSSFISLSWDIRHIHKLYGPSKQFVITYYPTTGNGINRTEARTTEMSYTINNLLPNTEYAISVSVYNGHSIGPYGQNINITTAEGVPGEVRNLSTTMITTTTVRIQWLPPIFLNGILKHYLVTVNEREFLVVNNISHIVDLEFFTTYNITVAAVTGGGHGLPTVTTVTTVEGPPSTPPMTIKLTSLSAFEIEMTWNSPSNESLNGILQNYIIEWRISGGSVSNVTLGSSTNSHQFKNLKPFTEYNVRIVAITVARGPFSDWYTNRTKEAVPWSVTSLNAVAINSSAINITWQPPINPNGHVTYRVTLLTIDDEFETAATSLVVGNLRVYTEYYVTVIAENTAGTNQSQITVRTGESVPSAPTELTVVTVFPTNISITWSDPHTPNGMVAYRVNCGTPMSTSSISSIQHYECQGLQPGEQYNISVIPYTGAGPGVAANITVTTPCQLPTIKMGSAKTSGVNLTITKPPCAHAQTQYHLVIVQQVSLNEQGGVVRPSKSLTQYTLEELKESTKLVKQLLASPPPAPVGKRQLSPPSLLPVYIAANTSSLGDRFTVGDDQQYDEYQNYKLQSNNSYRVAVAMLISNQQVPSLHFSTTVLIKTEVPTEKETEETTETASSDDNMLLIIIVAAAIVIAITLVSVILLFICCMCHGSRSAKEREKEELGTFERAGSLRSSINSIQLERNGNYRSSKKKKIVDPVEQRRSIIQTSELEGHPPIPVDGFLHKLSVLEECERQLFIDEFASLQDISPEFTNDVALMDYNFAKNRYNNILPYDHSRVKLTALKHMPGSDYINANYCDGHMKYRGYIATQGPLPSTVQDFWRMIWEQRSSVIVMLTRLEEGDRVKCHCYWPQDKDSVFTCGFVQVRLVDCTNFADYCIRTFRLSKLGHVNEFTVTQFHFTSWPDHGVPSVTTTMLMFVRRVQALCASLPEDSGPITIHCSAGVGRTGCYIVIDSALTRLKEKLSTIDIYGHVNLLRSQRPYMVQHEEQYFFTYEAVAEAIMCGETECVVSELSDHVEMLNQITEGSTLLEKEFKRLALEKGDPHQFLSAKKPANKDKNRYVNVLPYENSRVVLDKLIGEESSDYINASYINGYFTKNLFIATQSPLPATMVDFWRMIWECRCPIVVMVMERGVERYWPVDRIKHYNHLSVEPTTERHSVEYTYREFKLTHATTDEVHVVRHFQFLGWPDIGVPSSGLPLIELMDEVNKMHLSLDTDAPIIVHCKAGVAVTGVLVAMRVLLDQLKTERAVNVFQAVKVLRIQRPAMVQTMEQYRFLYDALVEYIGSDLHCRHGPSPPLHSSCTKLPYYSNDLLSSAHTFNSTTDVHAMPHSNI